MSNFYNNQAGTWVISGDFNSTSLLQGSGAYIEQAVGNGTVVYTFDTNGGSVYSNGQKQYDVGYKEHVDIVRVVNGLGTSSTRRVMYYPYKVSGRQARDMAVGDVEVVSFLETLINSLYGSGQQGAFFIPQPVVLGEQVLYQDAAGTTPVTADGDPVGLMLDISGNDNHATQGTSAARPIYRTDGVLRWLQFDGVDDFLNVGVGPKFISVAFTIGGNNQTIFGVGANFSRYIGTFTDGLLYVLWSASTNSTSWSTTPFSAFGTPHVVSSHLDNEPTDATLNSSPFNEQGTTNSEAYSNTVIGMRQGGNHLVGNIYGLIISSDERQDENRDKIDTYIAKLAGVSL